MNKLNISTRLMALVGALCLLLVIIGSIGIYGMAKSDDAMDTMYNDSVLGTSRVSNIRYLMLGNRLAIANALFEQTPERIKISTELVETNIGAIAKAWETYMAGDMTPAEAALAKDYAEKRALFVQTGLKPAVAALRAKDFVETRRLVVDVIRPSFDAAIDAADTLNKFQLDEAKSLFDADTARYHTIRTIAIAATVLALLLASFFGFALVRSITTPEIFTRRLLSSPWALR